MSKIKITLRKPNAQDKNFILSTWLKGQRYGSTYFALIQQDKYFEKYGERIIEILKTPGVSLNVACDEANPTWIAGFSVFRGDEIFWIHVRKDYRRRGIGRLLLGGQEMRTAKAITSIGSKIAQNHGIEFDPF